jgi:hypothetical protein
MSLIFGLILQIESVRIGSLHLGISRSLPRVLEELVLLQRLEEFLLPIHNVLMQRFEEQTIDLEKG